MSTNKQVLSHFEGTTNNETADRLQNLRKKKAVETPIVRLPRPKLSKRQAVEEAIRRTG